MSYNSTWSLNIWHCWLSPIQWYPPLLPYSRAYLSRLESGWEEAPCPPLMPLPPVPDDPPPVPANCRFPDKSFSTAARFPVRAASRSSCSFPIADPEKKSEEARGKRRKRGAWLREWNSSAIPFSPDRKLFLGTARVARKQNLPPPLDPSVLIHGAAGAQGGKVSFSSTAPPSSKLPLTSPPPPRVSSVTSLKLPFLSASTIWNPSDNTYNP